MEKEIKDYLHFYLGCEVMIEGKYKCKLTGFENGKPTILNIKNWDGVKVNEWHLIKPILRPLSDMTLDEMAALQIDSLEDLQGNLGQLLMNVSDFLFLLHYGFDIFGLIESGLAIDKAKAQ